MIKKLDEETCWLCCPRRGGCFSELAAARSTQAWQEAPDLYHCWQGRLQWRDSSLHHLLKARRIGCFPALLNAH